MSTFVVFAVVVLFVAAQQNVGKCVSISTIALVGSTEEETMGVVPHKEVVCVVRGLHVVHIDVVSSTVDRFYANVISES